jgi:hypothetical protein
MKGTPDQFGIAVAESKGPVLTFGQQKLLVKSTYSVEGARKVADLLIAQHKADLSPSQVATLRGYAKPAKPASPSEKSAKAGAAAAAGFVMMNNQ